MFTGFVHYYTTHTSGKIGYYMLAPDDCQYIILIEMIVFVNLHNRPLQHNITQFCKSDFQSRLNKYLVTLEKYLMSNKKLYFLLKYHSLDILYVSLGRVLFLNVMGKIKVPFYIRS